MAAGKGIHEICDIEDKGSIVHLIIFFNFNDFNKDIYEINIFCIN